MYTMARYKMVFFALRPLRVPCFAVLRLNPFLTRRKERKVRVHNAKEQFMAFYSILLKEVVWTDFVDGFYKPKLPHHQNVSVNFPGFLFPGLFEIATIRS